MPKRTLSPRRKLRLPQRKQQRKLRPPPSQSACAPAGNQVESKLSELISHVQPGTQLVAYCLKGSSLFCLLLSAGDKLYNYCTRLFIIRSGLEPALV